MLTGRQADLMLRYPGSSLSVEQGFRINMPDAEAVEWLIRFIYDGALADALLARIAARGVGPSLAMVPLFAAQTAASEKETTFDKVSAATRHRQVIDLVLAKVENDKRGFVETYLTECLPDAQSAKEFARLVRGALEFDLAPA